MPLLRAAFVAMAVALSTAPVACAQPAVPQSNQACTEDRAGVMTMPSGSPLPSVCQDGTWQSLTTPQPPADKWLSFGSPMTLHGQGMRNPQVAAGEWTATPQDATSQCRARQQAVVSPGVLSEPATNQGEAGQSFTFAVPARMFSIELAGYCLWTRK